MKIHHSLYFILLFAKLSLAQTPYLFPIKPGQQAFISGTMGELRPNHFHAGLDIKTDGVTGWPVHATANGFITRIKIEEKGYGNAIYIYHPETGHTSVYAHLERFHGAIAEYVRKNQYQHKSFTIELFPSKHDFVIKRGDIIAYSGNTGGSGGPHLHFELRDKNQDLINPLDFKFSEVKDTQAPLIHEILLTTIGIDSRVNDEFGRFMFKVSKQNEHEYHIHQPITVYGNIALAVNTDDHVNGSHNHNGTNYISITVDDNEIFYYKNKGFSFAKTRYINTHFDFPISDRGEGRFHNLYLKDGNQLPLYPTKVNNGIISIKDSSIHKVRVTCVDAYGNKSHLHLKLKGSPQSNNQLSKNQKLKSMYEKEVFENTLKISVNQLLDSVKLDNSHLKRAYAFQNETVFLYDLNKGLPKSMQWHDKTVTFDFIQKILPKEKTHIYTETANFHIPAGAFYDTTFFTYRFENDTFYIHNSETPLQLNINIELKIPFSGNKARTHVYSMDSENEVYFEGGNWELYGISFRTRSLGRYFLITDTIAPQVRFEKKKDEELYFEVEDKLSGIKTYNASLNGEWLLMHYDYKTNLIWSDRLDKTKPLAGTLKVVVSDAAGNTTEYTKEL